MEMSTYRGPSAEDRHQTSPTPNDSKATTSTTSIPTLEDPIATRKYCTLCNLLVCLEKPFFELHILIFLILFCDSS